MRPPHLAFLLALLAPLGLAACGEDKALARGGAEVPDDQCLPPAPPPGQQPVSSAASAAMTFRAKHNASMTAVEVYVGRLQGTGSNDLQLTLNRTLGSGAPDPGQVLASATFSSSQAAPNFGWVRVAFPTPVPVTVGQGLAIVVRATGAASIKWGAGSGDSYGEGGAYTSDGAARAWNPAAPPAQDLGFRSWVNP